MVRAPFYDENGVKRGAWSDEEDAKLRDYIHKYGIWNWRELPKLAGLSRCGKSCRLRWMNYLRPDLKRGNYSEEEEDQIIKLHDEFGNRWSTIASYLPGRTDNEIKNHWHTHLKSRWKKATDEKRPNETSKYEANNTRECEVESLLASMPSFQILESSPLSPETPYHQTVEIFESSPEASSNTYYFPSSSNSAPLPDSHWVSSEDFIAPSHLYAQPIGDFWTEPFVSDSSYFNAEGAYLSTYVPYDSDNMDLFYQVMQELPENGAYIYPNGSWTRDL